MGIAPGQYIAEGIRKKDIHRIKASLRMSTPSQENRRRHTRGQKRKREDINMKTEGPTYKAGDF